MLVPGGEPSPSHGDPHAGQRPRPRVPPVDPGPALPQRLSHVPNVEIDLPGGLTVPVGDAANGLCGGMAYTVRDLFEAGLAPPAMTRAPGDGPMFRYVADRLLDSLSLPFGPATYLKLMHPALPDGDLAMVHGRAWRMIRLEWPAIQGDLERGTLSPLGLVGPSPATPASSAPTTGAGLGLRPGRQPADPAHLRPQPSRRRPRDPVPGRRPPAPADPGDQLPRRHGVVLLPHRLPLQGPPPRPGRPAPDPGPPWFPAVADRSRPRRRCTWPGELPPPRARAPARHGGLAAQPGYRRSCSPPPWPGWPARCSRWRRCCWCWTAPGGRGWPRRWWPRPPCPRS